MKKIILLALILSSIATFGQAPNGFNYQATVRNNSGNLLTNQNVTFKFSIIKDLPNNSPLYTETTNITTDDLGQVKAIIGQGTVQVGQFSQIDWASGTFHLKIELNSGSGFIPLGTTQFLSVPYSLYSENSGSRKKNNTMTYLSDGF